MKLVKKNLETRRKDRVLQQKIKPDSERTFHNTQEINVGFLDKIEKASWFYRQQQTNMNII